LRDLGELRGNKGTPTIGRRRGTDISSRKDAPNAYAANPSHGFFDRVPDIWPGAMMRATDTELMRLMPPATRSALSPQTARAVAVWLLFCCGMIFLMVVIGGATRLTESGLSITEWKPITGIVPPLSEAAWGEEFARYQQIPQYRDIHAGMSLAEFKTIFLWEYMHRLWGRLIGFVFAVPLLWFLLRRKITKPLALKLGGIFVLGGLQGALGWYMVASGLADRDFVSPYRLAAHLGFAALIYAATLWLALDLLRWSREKAVSAKSALSRAVPAEFPAALSWTRRGASLTALMVFLTLVAGGFVAGLHAGLIYNTFPLMDGRLFPAGYWELHPLWLNWFENVTAVQFDHRLLAVTTLMLIILVWLAGFLEKAAAPQRRWLDLLLAAGLLQVGLGISTLVLAVPIPLGVLHQGGAMLLLTAAIAARHRLRRSKPEF
jgi:heme a synthase